MIKLIASICVIATCYCFWSCLKVASDADDYMEECMGDKEYEERAQKLIDGKITPEEFVEYYNETMDQDNPDETCGYNPHEHI